MEINRGCERERERERERLGEEERLTREREREARWNSELHCHQRKWWRGVEGTHHGKRRKEEGEDVV